MRELDIQTKASICAICIKVHQRPPSALHCKYYPSSLHVLVYQSQSSLFRMPHIFVL